MERWKETNGAYNLHTTSVVVIISSVFLPQLHVPRNPVSMVVHANLMKQHLLVTDAYAIEALKDQSVK